jgi:hypothetical protein
LVVEAYDYEKHSKVTNRARRNIVNKVDGQVNVRSVEYMALSSTSTNKKFAAALHRRNARIARASIDINADFAGRGSMGDPRLDLARVDRYLRA